MSLPLYVHSHHKCATRWQIAYLEKVAKLNGLTFALEDSPFSLKAKGADITFFGNSSYSASASGELFGPHVYPQPAEHHRVGVLVASQLAPRRRGLAARATAGDPAGGGC